MAFPTFSSGDVLTATDMNAVGLWLVKSQTIGSAVVNVTVSNAFSATYDAYLIVLSGAGGSTGSGIQMRLGSTNTGYYGSAYVIPYSGAAALSQVNNGAQWSGLGVFTTDSINGTITLINPYAARRTYFTSSYIYGSPSGGGDAATWNGYLNDATSYTSFTLYAVAGNMTGGTITVYGYRKA